MTKQCRNCVYYRGHDERCNYSGFSVSKTMCCNYYEQHLSEEEQQAAKEVHLSHYIGVITVAVIIVITSMVLVMSAMEAHDQKMFDLGVASVTSSTHKGMPREPSKD